MSDFLKRAMNPQGRTAHDAVSSIGEVGTHDAFLKGIVTEVISNPLDYFSRNVKIDGVEQNYTIFDLETGAVTPDDKVKSFSNSNQVPFVVQNTVAIRLTKHFSTAKEGPSILCFPFFPQHISLPVKPGEYVWVYKTNANEYYWVCRISGARQVDDVNFTHLPRANNITLSNKKTKDLSLFYNFDSTKGQSAPPASFFHDIANSSIAYKEEFTGETVPRIAKDCSDLLIQGSNNAHILLGKEKFEEVSSVNPTEMTPYTLEADLGEQNRKPLSPAIDICVLRKARELFDLKDMIAAAKTAETVETSINEAHAGLGSGLSSAVGGRIENTGIEYFELEKARESLNPDLNKDIFTQEFIDSDIYNCIARIYMTNASTIDDLLFIPSLEGENSSSPQDVLGLGNYGAMAALGANTRIVGTETIKIQNIVGSSGIQFTPQGDVIIHANRAGGAKIVLEAEGDIRIVPGTAGIVKIGAVTDAEDSMFVPVGAFLSPLLPNTDTGYVGTSEQIMTTAGGLLPTNDPTAPPGIPVYATKVKLY
tara:strand:+ start:43 stop:1650 length:1608 start_codon:yes stop_codon:yes gene_type:complete